MTTEEYKNAVPSVSQPTTILILSDSEAPGWCEQFTQEGYDVFHLVFPMSDDVSRLMYTKLNDNGSDFAIITFGIPEGCVETFKVFAQSLVKLGLKACIHYCPQVTDGKQLLVVDFESKYVPAIFHIAATQEVLHASLLPVTENSSLGYKLKPAQYPPVAIHTYPLVPSHPAFPLLSKAPASVTPGQNKSIDPYVLSATNVAYTRTLELLKREIGPNFDLEKIWGEHLSYEFVDRNALKTMSTMVKVPYVNHVPTMTGGVGYNDLARFYKYHFTSETVTPPDTEIIPVSRTVGADRIIDEMIFKCTHTTEIDYFLPGIKPTGKALEIALVGVVAFRGDKLCFEHIYWDQASTLVQLGLLDRTGIPVAGREVAQKVLDPFGMPSNMLMERWSVSAGSNIE